MPTYTDALRFLQAVFPDHAKHGIFAHSVVPKGMSHIRSGGWLDPNRDCYWSIAAFPDDGSTVRNNARALEVRALVIDDVGTKVPEGAVRLALGTPTARVATSAGNYQWTYRLSRPVPVAGWGAFFAAVEVLVGQKLEGKDAVHLFRLPMGVNTKPGRGGFNVRFAEVTTSILQVDLILGNLTTSPSPVSPPLSGPGPLGLDELRELVGFIPNDLERDGWIEVGHGIKALCENDVDGFVVFDEWSALHDSYDAAKTKAAWDSFGAGGLKSKGGLLRDRAEKSKAFAEAAFNDNPPEPPEPTAGVITPTHVDMVEDIIRAERGTLGWMSNGAGRWAAYDPVLSRWVIEEHDALMRAAVRDAVHTARLAADPKDARKMAEGKWRGALQSLMVRDRRLMLPFEKFDADLDMFGVPGGVVRLGASGEVQESGAARQMVSKSMAVKPAPAGTKGVAWEAFLDDFTMGDPELRAWWQAFMGYCLTGHVYEHAVVFLYGPGGNGKSVFLDTIADVMGPYHERAGHALFMASQGSKHTAAVADLVGARLVTSPDVPVGCAWDLGLIKPLTGGGTFKAQFMRENWFRFTPRFKLVLAGNEKPALGGVDASIRRRFWLVPAMYVPKRINKQLVDVLRGEREAILRWMLDGWAAYNIGGLPKCRLIERETDEYLNEADTFGKWKASIVKAPGDLTRHRIADLWSSWDAFRASEGSWKASPVNMQGLSTKLREAGYSVDRDNKGGYVDGISITKSASGVF